MADRLVRHRILREHGFTLLEVILGLAVAGSVALVGVQAMKGWAQSEKASATAAYVAKIRDATQDMLHGPRDFEVFYSLAENTGSGSVQIPIYADDPAEDISVMYGIKETAGANGTVPGSPSLSQVSAALNPLKTPMTLVVATDGVPGKRSLHLALVSTQRAPEDLVRKTAALIGGGGGYISAVPPTSGFCLTACERTLRSAFGDWEVALDAFVGTEWESDVTSAPPSLQQGAYLVVYRHITEDEIEGDYLYRSQIPGAPDVNTMHVPMDLAGNSVVGADNVYVAGNLTVRESLAVQGHTNLSGNFSTAELVVDGNVFGGTMEISRTFVSNPLKIDETALATSGTLLVDGTIATSYAGVDSTFGGMIKIEDYFQDSDDNYISANNISMAGLQNTKGEFIVKGTSHIANLKVKGKLAIEDLKTNSVKADYLEATDALINRHVDIAGDLSASDPIKLQNVVFDISKPPPVYQRVWGSMDDCHEDADEVSWCNIAEVIDTEYPEDPITVHPGDILPDGLTKVLKIKEKGDDRGVYVEKDGIEKRLDVYTGGP
jgi:prepilin-type N-terminal cleavage/methylation domain-containing protein